MATTLFRDTTYSAFGLIEDIRQGEVALPDIQCPFVWGATRVAARLLLLYESRHSLRRVKDPSRALDGVRCPPIHRYGSKDARR
jgi:hypothetical protein